VLYAFDLIEHDGIDLRDLPLIERKFSALQTARQGQARHPVQ
jgi:ATP-dependent DNA ligase